MYKSTTIRKDLISVNPIEPDQLHTNQVKPRGKPVIKRPNRWDGLGFTSNTKVRSELVQKCHPNKRRRGGSGRFHQVFQLVYSLGNEIAFRWLNIYFTENLSCLFGHQWSLTLLTNDGECILGIKHTFTGHKSCPNLLAFQLACPEYVID